MRGDATVIKSRRIVTPDGLFDGGVVIGDGTIAGLVDGDEATRRGRSKRLEDYGDLAILPGLVDVHVHVLRFTIRLSPAPYPHWPRCLRAWSTSTSAIIASTIGTARGRTQGSWRPRALMVVSWASTSMRESRR